MSELFPRLFGKYALLKSLARGGMGEIYLAAAGRPDGLHKLCVIKKVITEKTDRAKLNRFLDEAKVVLRLSHANLVSTFDAGDVDGELFIAMELVEGKDLREIWNRCVRTRTRIPVDVALVVVREIARALAYVHAYGGLRLVHRDVAPPNILLSYFGEVKLTDFGLARSTLKQEHTAPGVVFGRASYLAPEQARGEVADARTDVYSLGIVLWELLTGQPYLQLAGLDPATSLSLVRNPKTQPPSTRAPWISSELDTVVLRALAADRAARFQSAEEMRRALSEAMSRVAPRADTERVADFLRGLYRDVVGEETTERERLLSETSFLFTDDPPPEGKTPGVEGVVPLGTGDFELEEGSDEAMSVSESAPAPASGNEVTVVAASPFVDPSTVVGAPPHESLAASAQRARAGSQARSGAGEYLGSDAPTTVWRKGRGPRGEDAAQTFVGRVIDNRYNIQHRIGEGGMGTVYAAEHVEIGKRVAVKILHRLFSGEEQLVERFRGEARAASRVGHPHIVDVTDFGTTEEGCAYFVMEYLEGMDLADVLVQDHRLPPERMVRIAVQICQALESAHEAGVIHRDLKPENIFLVARMGQPDFVKVLDFGIARDLSRESSRLTNPGMAMGTPEYMAPEQVMGKPADRRTDIYAVGALLYEMIMGVAPFKSNSEQEMLQAKRRSPESLRRKRPDVPAAVDTVILRALNPDPDRRPQTMAELEAELAKIVWGGSQPSANSGETDAARARRRESENESKNENKNEGEPAHDRRGTVRNNGSDRSGKITRFLTSDRKDAPAPPPADGPPQAPAAATPAHGSSQMSAEIDHATGTEVGHAVDTQVGLATGGDAAEAVGTSTIIGVGVGVGVGFGVDVGAAAGLGLAAITTAPVAIAPVVSENRGEHVDDAPISVKPRTPTAPYGLSVAQSIQIDGEAGAALISRFLEPSPPLVIPADRDAVARSSTLAARRTGGVAMVVVALLLGGGAWLSWMAKNGPPAFARGLLSRLVPGSSHAVAVAPTSAVKEPSPSALPSPSPAPALAKADIDPSRKIPTPSVAAGIATAPPVEAAAPRAVAKDGAPDVAQQTPPFERARTALAAGAPDDAIAVLRPIAAKDSDEARALLADALVASGWNDVRRYRWNTANRKAREAMDLVPAGRGHGAHALLGETLYAFHDFSGALNEFTKALAESPRDMRLKRRVIRSLRQLRAPPAGASEPAAEPKVEPPSAAAEPTPEQ